MIKKFLAAINLPRHIKRYLIIKKIENYTRERRKRRILFILNLAIAAVVIAAFAYIFLEDSVMRYRWYAGAAAGVLVIGWIIKISRFVLKYDQHHQSITKLILKDREGRYVRTWDLQRKTSLVIGKSLGNGVDIDLEDADYASLISKQHSVLNFADDAWYVEDIGSTNGSGIKRSGENTKFRLEPGKPYRLNPGDIIYVANTQLLVK